MSYIYVFFKLISRYFRRFFFSNTHNLCCTSKSYRPLLTFGALSVLHFCFSRMNSAPRSEMNLSCSFNFCLQCSFFLPLSLYLGFYYLQSPFERGGRSLFAFRGSLKAVALSLRASKLNIENSTWACLATSFYSVRYCFQNLSEVQESVPKKKRDKSNNDFKVVIKHIKPQMWTVLFKVAWTPRNTRPFLSSTIIQEMLLAVLFSHFLFLLFLSSSYSRERSNYAHFRVSRNESSPLSRSR